jgi:restriction system protein
VAPVDLSEFTLLNRPALMLLVLKAAAEAPTTLADCRARLDRELARVHERPDVPDLLITAELADVIEHMTVAGLLAESGDAGLTLTPRGRQVLQSHPMGIDETVLMQFAEYKAFVRNFARRKTIDDPREKRYDEGHAAWQAGQTLTENPYPPDTADHLAWENGWSEARDAGLERRHRP